MQESPQVLEWQREARKEGQKEGREEGRKEGIASLRNQLKAALENRFQQTIPESILTAIEMAEDFQTLDRYFEAAWSASSLEDIAKKLDRL